jgi:voltage-gated potassium channel
MSPVTRFSIAFLMLILLLGGGALGYHLIEGWSLWDSIYMTIITVTTVGYGEVHPLSQNAQKFTVLLLALSLVTAGFSVTTVIGFVFEGQILTAMRGRRMEMQISKLRDHYIICGCGG